MLVPKPSAGSSPPQSELSLARFCVSSPRPWVTLLLPASSPNCWGSEGRLLWLGHARGLLVRMLPSLLPSPAAFPAT